MRRTHASLIAGTFWVLHGMTVGISSPNGRKRGNSPFPWLIILWCLNDVQLYSHLMQFIRISIWSIPHFDSVSSSIISSFQLGEARRIAQAHNAGDGADAWLPLRFAVSPGAAGYEETQN